MTNDSVAIDRKCFDFSKANRGKKRNGYATSWMKQSKTFFHYNAFFRFILIFLRLTYWPAHILNIQMKKQFTIIN